jgi:hypothetical protein
VPYSTRKQGEKTVVFSSSSRCELQRIFWKFVGDYQKEVRSLRRAETEKVLWDGHKGKTVLEKRVILMMEKGGEHGQVVGYRFGMGTL